MIFGIPVREFIAFVLMGLGLIFLVGSAIGMLRLPDFYSRVHASGNSETLGTALSTTGSPMHRSRSSSSSSSCSLATPSGRTSSPRQPIRRAIRSGRGSTRTKWRNLRNRPGRRRTDADIYD